MLQWPYREGTVSLNYTLIAGPSSLVYVYISRNIKHAVENSNSAIILLSQCFLDSDWCNTEFNHCFMESERDPVFKPFVIMMQPIDTLVNISGQIETFIKDKKYLEVNDGNKFKKIAQYLEWVKKPKND